MKLAIFGGSFDPVHAEHVRYVRAAIASLGLDGVYVVPLFEAPHKHFGAAASAADRLEMCRLAFDGIPGVTVSDCELRRGGTSYTYVTCRDFAEKFPAAQRWFLVGADMLEDFFTWRQPEDILANVRLAACTRGGERPLRLAERFYERFGTHFDVVPFAGEEVSSARVRVDLAFERPVAALHPAVAEYIAARGLYRYPAIAPALALEKPERREHSYRVAVMAVARARSAKIAEWKALLAAALHDCGKYVAPSSPLLKGFLPPQKVPAPVMHQYTGAYLAQYVFGISDEEVLDAIRYHTSGRAGMTPLGKLVYLADLLEEGRSFAGIEALRELFRKDLDACFYSALRQQTAYLRQTNKPVYPLTEQALCYEMAKNNKYDR